MSKEMTPKEALQMIQDNLTPRVLGIFPVEFHIVKEALDRLELLEKENSNQSNLIESLNRLIIKAKQENQELKIFANQDIEKLHIGNKNLTEENEKYKKVIAWLKNTFEITLDSKVRISDGIDCIQAFPIDLKTNEVLYDLLKEFLK